MLLERTSSRLYGRECLWIWQGSWTSRWMCRQTQQEQHDTVWAREITIAEACHAMYEDERYVEWSCWHVEQVWWQAQPSCMLMIWIVAHPTHESDHHGMFVWDVHHLWWYLMWHRLQTWWCIELMFECTSILVGDRSHLDNDDGSMSQMLNIITTCIVGSYDTDETDDQTISYRMSYHIVWTHGLSNTRATSKEYRLDLQFTT